MDRRPADYDLPGIRTVRVVRSCPQCGQQYVIKVRPKGHAAFDIACTCGRVFEVKLEVR